QIWRCYHVWGQSYRTISVPLILLITECGLSFATMVFSNEFTETTSEANVILYNNISNALVFVSLGTTVITTFLIGYRIHSVARLDGSPSKRLFNHIVIMIVESAAAYSLALLLEVIFSFVPSTPVPGSTMREAGYYIQSVLIIVPKQGIAPTILVARIATNDNHTVASSTTTHISGVQFVSQQGSRSGRSANATGGHIHVAFRTDDAEPTPAIEVKRESSVDAPFGNNQV
ncbi:hypothetical protein CVT25_007071, partial [Psilocybe cyanescens]